MLKFFQNAADLTPRANTQSGAAERNPFESTLPAGTSPSRKASTSSMLASPSASGTRTPTIARAPSQLHLTPNPISPSSSFFSGANGGGGPGDVTPGAAAFTLGAVPVTPGGRATTGCARRIVLLTYHASSPHHLSTTALTAVSMAEPDFSFTTQPSALARKRETGLVPKGRLAVKLISARHLSCPSADSRPYVVVSFDQNEFVSREPIHEEGEEATGVAISKENGGSSPTATRQAAVPPDAAKVDTNGTAKESIPMGSTPTNSSGLGRALDRHRNSADMAVSPSAGSSSALDDRAAAPLVAALASSLELSAYSPTWKHEVTFDVMNEKSVVQVQIFDRSVEEEMFLGMTEIRPRLVNGHTVDQWFALSPRAEEVVTGEIRIQIRYEKLDLKKGIAVNDFDFLRMIGKGTFGRVFQVRKKDTKRIYAMKVLSKREIVAKKEVAHTIGERKILQRSDGSPFLLGLKFSFQSDTDLYLVMDYKSGGELFHHLQKEGRFTEDRARFYTAEIVLAFEHLHKYDIVYRDLKPENILLDATGHIVLCDFGLSKPDLPSDALTNTFCGTTEYLAPEVLLDDHGYSKLVDFWSLGVLLFEMCCGWSPFYAEDTQQMYKLICFGKVKFPRGVIGEDGKQFVKGLLNRNPKHRLGATRDAEELKEHAFFSSIDWDALAARAIAPPFKPYVESDESVANFDPEFTEANLLDEAPHDVNFDEDDPSADWIDQASRTSRLDASGPVQIKARRPPLQTAPLSSSVQENF
ncbi:serine/threonine protein kinase SCH9, partial [Phenoliferia sp. Uapishka_3]